VEREARNGTYGAENADVMSVDDQLRTGVTHHC
jgi:hypothetical protein